MSDTSSSNRSMSTPNSRASPGAAVSLRMRAPHAGLAQAIADRHTILAEGGVVGMATVLSGRGPQGRAQRAHAGAAAALGADRVRPPAGAHEKTVSPKGIDNGKARPQADAVLLMSSERNRSEWNEEW